MDASEMDNATKVPVEKTRKKRFTVNQALEIAMLLYMTMLYIKMNEIQEALIILSNQ